MSVISQSFNAIFPLLAYMALGYFLKKRDFLRGNSSAEINRLVFNVFLPLNIFEGVYTTDLKGSFDIKIAAFVLVTGFLSYFIIEKIIPLREKDRTMIPVMVQGIHKSNYNLLAIPIVSSFYPDNVGMTAVLMAVITVMVNICSSAVFEKYSGKAVSKKQLAIKILKNPLVISSLAGVVLNLSGLTLPKVVLTGVIKKLAALATPIALIALGSTFDFSKLAANGKRLAIVAAGKLVLQPALILTAAILCGIRGADLIAIMVFSGSPTAVNSYSTAVAMGGNEELAGQIVVLTSCLSIGTMFLMLCALGAFGFI